MPTVVNRISDRQDAAAACRTIWPEQSYNHGTRPRNRRRKQTPFSGAGFRRRFFIPCTSGM